MKIKILLSTLLALAWIAFSLIPPVEAVKNNTVAPDFTLPDSNGNQHSLSDFKGKFVVLEWTNFDCPFVRKHYDTGNMQELQKYFTNEGVVWLSINSSAPGKQGNFSNQEINQRIQQQGASPNAYLIDADGKVGKLYQAQTTPHIFLIDPNQKLIYQGAIDDKPSFDKADVPKAKNYLLQALNESKSSGQISTPQTKSYGCSVKY